MKIMLRSFEGSRFVMMSQIQTVSDNIGFTYEVALLPPLNINDVYEGKFFPDEPVKFWRLVFEFEGKMIGSTRVYNLRRIY